MKILLHTIVLCIFLSLLANKTLAQGYAADISLGMGNVTGVDHGRGKIQLGIMCLRSMMHDRVHAGIEITIGGNFIPGDEAADDVTGVETIGAANANWTGVQFRGRYFLTDGIFKSQLGTFRPYLGMSVGGNNYWFNVNTIEADMVNRWNLAVTPEVGVDINKFKVALRYLIGGETPAFSGTRPPSFGGNEVVLVSDQINVIMVTIGYTFNFN